MADREPEPGEGGGSGPFLWIEGSPVEVWALGGGSFRVATPGHEQLLAGFEAPPRAAHALAEQLG